MDAKQFKDALHVAELAVNHAQAVREAHRKRSARENRDRQADITIALTRLKRAMRPIRSELARIPYQLNDADPARGAMRALVYGELIGQRAALLDASDQLQRERRKLWKMQSRKKVRNGKP